MKRKKGLKRDFPNRRKAILVNRLNCDHHVYTDRYGNEIILNIQKRIMKGDFYKNLDFLKEAKRVLNNNIKENETND